LRVGLRARLRAEVAFGSVEALQAQLARDAVEARKALGLLTGDKQKDGA
jgi:FAD synthase